MFLTIFTPLIIIQGTNVKVGVNALVIFPFAKCNADPCPESVHLLMGP